MVAVSSDPPLSKETPFNHRHPGVSLYIRSWVLSEMSSTLWCGELFPALAWILYEIFGKSFKSWCFICQMGHHRALPPRAECRWADVSLQGLQGSFLKESGGLFLVLCHSRHRDLTPWWCWLWPVHHSWLPRAERLEENPSLCQFDSLWAGGIQSCSHKASSPMGADLPLARECLQRCGCAWWGCSTPKTGNRVGSVGVGLFVKWLQCLPNLIPLINKPWEGVETYSGLSVPTCKSQNQNKKKLLLMWSNFSGLFVSVTIEEISTVA